MSWHDNYSKAKKALASMYDAAETDRDRDEIEVKQLELIEANMRFLIEQMQERAAEMHVLIQSLELVITPNESGKITGAAKRLNDVLNVWKKAIGIA